MDFVKKLSQNDSECSKLERDYKRNIIITALGSVALGMIFGVLMSKAWEMIKFRKIADKLTEYGERGYSRSKEMVMEAEEKLERAREYAKGAERSDFIMRQRNNLADKLQSLSDKVRVGSISAEEFEGLI